MLSSSIRKLVLDHKEDFMSLFINYSSLYGGLIIKKSKKVFYSDAEREYYERNMTSDLVRDYQKLYHKYISSKYPELKNYSWFILPRSLAEIFEQSL